MSTTEVSTTFEITVTADHLARPVVVIPDEIAHRLRVAALKGWIDTPGIGHGASEDFPADHWVARVAHTILTAVAEQAHDATTLQDAKYKRFYGFVVGESGWDSTTHAWKDYCNTSALRVPGAIHTSYDGRGTITFEG
jgi:hypothetical protein